MKMCRTAGFKLVLEKSTPTFYSRKRGRGMSIFLSWANFLLSKRKVLGASLNHTYRSGHSQALQITMNNAQAVRPACNNSSCLKTLRKQAYTEEVHA